MIDIKSAISHAAKILKEKKIKTAVLDSEILMLESIKKDNRYLITNSEKKINKKNLKFFEDLIIQRANRKPVAYLLKKKGFWKNEFIVSKDTLIPRPDTELLVEQVLSLTKNKSKLRILDIGVGSGCILLSIIKEKKDFYATGIDISKKCIEISKKNADKLNIKNKIKFFKSDIDNFSLDKYDLIVSNPPYIKKLDLKYLEKDIIRFEPKMALDGGLDGISVIRKVITRSSELIKKNGKLILEIGFDQSIKVKKILRDRGFYINKVVKDFGKNDRCIVSTKI
tara:strand:+ start:336 stop:1181 length:846 start_codon:yes stop_codon:yes gene_type:complete